MTNLITEEGNARRYTDAIVDYLIDSGMVNEDDILLNLLYWLSDDNAREWAKVNLEVTFDEEEDEEEYV